MLVTTRGDVESLLTPADVDALIELFDIPAEWVLHLKDDKSRLPMKSKSSREQMNDEILKFVTDIM